MLFRGVLYFFLRPNPGFYLLISVVSSPAPIHLFRDGPSPYRPVLPRVFPPDPRFTEAIGLTLHKRTFSFFPVTIVFPSVIRAEFFKGFWL